jgi:WD40 repeat protein
MFISASMDNKIHMILDNDFGENELIRTLEMKDVTITSLNFDPITKMVIVSTNTGITAFYESDTGKQTGSFSEATHYEEITSINLIEKLPYIITTTTDGKINFIALPPLLFKF